MENLQQRLQKGSSVTGLGSDFYAQGSKPSMTTKETSTSDISQISPNEPRITPDEFRQVIRYAQMLQQAELGNGQTRQRINDALSPYQEGIPLSLVNKVITDVMDIGEPYVERALELYFPSAEQIKSDDERFGVKIDKPTLKKMLYNEAIIAAKTIFGEDIEVKNPWYNSLYLCRDIQFNLFFTDEKGKTRKKRIGKISSHTPSYDDKLFIYDVNINHPSFLKVWKEFLKRESIFKGQLCVIDGSLKRNYIIE